MTLRLLCVKVGDNPARKHVVYAYFEHDGAVYRVFYVLWPHDEKLSWARVATGDAAVLVMEHAEKEPLSAAVRRAMTGVVGW